jgi:hypothetical protein
MPPQIHLFPTRRSRPSFPYPSDPIRAHRLTAPAIPRAAQNHSGLIPVGRAGSWVQLASRGGRRCSGSTSKRCRGGSGGRRSGSSGRPPATAYCGSSLRPRRQGAIYESPAGPPGPRLLPPPVFFFWRGGLGAPRGVGDCRPWPFGRLLLALLLASSGV